MLSYLCPVHVCLPRTTPSYLLTRFKNMLKGMFPYVCAAMIPVFCDPGTVSKALRAVIETGRGDGPGTTRRRLSAYKPPGRAKRNTIAACVCAYAALQLFMPYSHFITQVSVHDRERRITGIVIKWKFPIWNYRE